MLVSLLLSALFGYVAAKVMNFDGKWYVYMLLGIAGGFVGSIIFEFVGFHATSTLAEAIVSIFGACLVIFLYRKLK